MDNNSTNISKTNNDFSFQLVEKTKTYDVGNSCPGLGRALKCAGVKPVNSSRTLPSW